MEEKKCYVVFVNKSELPLSPMYFRACNEEDLRASARSAHVRALELFEITEAEYEKRMKEIC